MAERRMFAKTIIDSDAFLDMPLSAQALYFHLSMRADDDGFINNPRKIQKTVGASEDDLKLLLMKRFVIGFESGVVVIRHWKIHNYIRNDRYSPTLYRAEMNQLEETDCKEYALCHTTGIPNDNQVVDKRYTNGIPSDNQVVDKRYTQVRLGKGSVGKDNVESVQKREARFAPPSLEDVKAYCSERKNTVDPERFIDFYESKGWYVGRNKMKDWKAAVRSWESRSRQKSAEYDNSFDPGASLQV